MMNGFVKVVESTPSYSATKNGALTYDSSLDACVDMFQLVGASRKNPEQAVKAFRVAAGTNPELAARIALWARDVRGGAGEREVFRKILREMAQIPSMVKYARAIIKALPEFGRWDDLLVLERGTLLDGFAADVFAEGLKSGNGLAGKWAPRKGPHAVFLRNRMGLTPKQYRKLIVGLSQTVEQKMCAQEWTNINYSHVPSVAAHIYQAAFARHDPAGYQTYRNNLIKVMAGEKIDGVKVNAGAIYPHTIVQSLHRHSDNTVSLAQWEALPNYVQGPIKMIPVVDVSGSMETPVGGNTTAMDVSLGVGLYLADKQTGPFKDMVLTFSENSKIQLLRGNIVAKLDQLRDMDWGMSTNLQSAFKEILSVAVRGKVKASDMPEYVLVISDMEFNQCVSGTNHDGIKEQYEAAGYQVPKVVFWNVNGRAGNSPALANDKDVALVSGFSPAIMTAVLSTDTEQFTPKGVMLKTVMAPRYDVVNSEVNSTVTKPRNKVTKKATKKPK